MSGTGAEEPTDWSEIASQLTFDDVIDGAPFGVVTIDESSTVRYTNEGLGRILGYDPAALVGEPLTVLMPERFEDRHFESFARYQRTGERNLDWDAIELPALHADGHEVPLSITFREHEIGGRQLYTGVFRDISDEVRRRERLQERTEQLERANAELEQFTYVVSHDLQEPLRMISSYLDLLEREYGDELDEEAREYIDFATDGADRLRGMIDDLLAYSRLQRHEESFETVDVAAVLRAVREDLAVAIDEADGTVTHDELPTITADRSRLRQLLQNLVQNAIDHGGTAPTVHVGYEEPPDHHVFTVADDGPGIPPEEQEEVFDIFQQGSDAGEGSGIGLAICQRVAELHGGDIAVESAVGDGTTFHVRLPKAPDEHDGR